MSAISDALHAMAYKPSERLESGTLRQVARQIFKGEAETPQVAAFLLGLRMMRETGREISPFVSEMLSAAKAFPRPDDDEPLVDTCGTGGDGYNTFNISTATALLAAAAGVRIVKHGNRSASSQCGSADVLESLGYDIEMTPEDSAAHLREHNFCFLYARSYHPAMRHAAEARKSLGIPTLFNLCGPLANPAHPTHQLIGVSSRQLVQPMAEALRQLGVRAALVVHGGDGLDEISLSQVTEGIHVDERGETHSWMLSPLDLGVRPVEMEELIGGDPEVNAEVVRSVLDGRQGPHADIVCLNLAAVLWLIRDQPRIESAFAKAREIQRSGAGADLLRKLTEETR